MFVITVDYPHQVEGIRTQLLVGLNTFEEIKPYIESHAKMTLPGEVMPIAYHSYELRETTPPSPRWVKVPFSEYIWPVNRNNSIQADHATVEDGVAP